MKMSGLKEKVTQTQHKQHKIGDSPEVPGSGEQGTLNCKVLQDLFLMKPLLSRAEGVADFPNTQKLTQRIEKQGNRGICPK